MGNAKPANDRRGRNCIWRRDNRAKRKSSRPGKCRHNGVGDAGNRHRRRQYQADCQQEYHPQISPKITPRRKQRRRIKERRENEVKDDVRIELHLRQSRQETHGESPDHEHDRIRQRKSVRQHGQDSH